MESNFVYSKMTDMSVEMQTQTDKNMQVLRGKALLNENESRLSFVQNPPRGPRSVEISRTAHSRMVRRPDGLYTVTFRFDADEKMVLPALIAEVRSIVKRSQADRQVMKDKQKGVGDENKS